MYRIKKIVFFFPNTYSADYNCFLNVHDVYNMGGSWQLFDTNGKDELVFDTKKQAIEYLVESGLQIVDNTNNNGYSYGNYVLGYGEYHAPLFYLKRYRKRK